VDAMRRALALSRTSPAPGRLWLILTHLNEEETTAWKNTLSVFGLRPSYLPFGSETLAFVARPRG
jgi:hypothetical protein